MKWELTRRAAAGASRVLLVGTTKFNRSLTYRLAGWGLDLVRAEVLDGQEGGRQHGEHPGGHHQAPRGRRPGAGYLSAAMAQHGDGDGCRHRLQGQDFFAGESCAHASRPEEQAVQPGRPAWTTRSRSRRTSTKGALMMRVWDR